MLKHRHDYPYIQLIIFLNVIILIILYCVLYLLIGKLIDSNFRRLTGDHYFVAVFVVSILYLLHSYLYRKIYKRKRYPELLHNFTVALLGVVICIYVPTAGMINVFKSPPWLSAQITVFVIGFLLSHVETFFNYIFTRFG